MRGEDFFIIKINEAIKELLKQYSCVDEKEIFAMIEREAENFLSKVFNCDVNCFLFPHGEIQLIYPFKIKKLRFSDLSKNVIRGLIGYVKNVLKGKLEVEEAWQFYRRYRARIKTLVRGRVIRARDDEERRGVYVEFADPFERAIGFCCLRDMWKRDFHNLRWDRGRVFYFMIKNVVAYKNGYNIQPEIFLTRRSPTFIKLLFRQFGVDDKVIKEIQFFDYGVEIKASEFLPKEVIRQVSLEIDGNVKVMGWEKNGKGDIG